MMRLLIGVLLVLNLLVFLYGYLGLDRQDAATPAGASRPDVGSIRLLSARVVSGEAPDDTGPATEAVPAGESAAVQEAPPPAPEPVPESGAPEAAGEGAVGPLPDSEPAVAAGVEETASSDASEEATAPPVRHCGELGPFRNRAQTRRFLRSLDLAAELHPYRRPTPVPEAYWVFIPPAADRAEARRRVQALREAGVKDLWLMPEGEFRNAISLGLFSREEAARAHARELQEKGFDVEMRPRMKEKDRYWIAFEGLDDPAFEKLSSALSAGQRVIERPCPQTSADG